jgi:hypothetical protein
MDCSQGCSYADRETPGHVLAPKILARRVVKILDYWALILHDLVMTKTSEFLTKSSESLILAAAKTAFVPTSRSVVAANRGSGSVTAALEPDPKSAWDARCLWCDRNFTPRTTGGSAQRFCCTGHRQQFWIAARRWTMRAIEAGLLSVDCLKVSHTSVHAA